MKGGEATANNLKIEIIKDFKKEFDIDLTDEDFTENENGFEIDYRDYDLNKFGTYRHSSLIESCRLESDGRSEYLRIYANLSYDDYFGV